MPQLVCQLDTILNAAYTTEFLDDLPEHTGRRGSAKTMDKKRLDYYKKKLLARREDLLKTIARTEEEGRQADDDPTVDLADKAANSYTKEFLFGMTNTDRALLNQIEVALKRIAEEEYGTCMNCQEKAEKGQL